MKHSRNLCIGPGGRNCNCCFPRPGSKARKLEYRKAKKLDNKAAMKAAKSRVRDIENVPDTRRFKELV